MVNSNVRRHDRPALQAMTQPQTERLGVAALDYFFSEKGWLFREPIDAFAKRYDQKPVSQQDDLAMPKLKKNIGKQDKDGTTQ